MGLRSNEVCASVRICDEDDDLSKTFWTTWMRRSFSRRFNNKGNVNPSTSQRLYYYYYKLHHANAL